MPRIVPRPPRVEPDEVATGVADRSITLIDYGRTANEFDAGRIPGATRVPRDVLFDPSRETETRLPPRETIEQALRDAGVGAGRRIVCYDDSRGLWAGRACWVLAYLGRPNVMLLAGGLAAWRRSGRPIEQGVRSSRRQDRSGLPTPESRSLDSRVSSRAATDEPPLVLIVDTDWVAQNLDNPDVIFVDTRRFVEYAGLTIDANRRGRIPGAIRPGRLVNDSCAPQEWSTIVVYCSVGVSVGRTWARLKSLGYSDVRIYPGSWASYAARTDLPVSRRLWEKGYRRGVRDAG